MELDDEDEDYESDLALDQGGKAYTVKQSGMKTEPRKVVVEGIETYGSGPSSDSSSLGLGCGDPAQLGAQGCENVLTWAHLDHLVTVEKLYHGFKDGEEDEDESVKTIKDVGSCSTLFVDDISVLLGIAVHNLFV